MSKMELLNAATKLRIGTKVYAPYTNPCGLYTLERTKNCTDPGIENELLGYILNFSNIPWELVPLTQVPYGSYDVQNGTWSGTLRALLTPCGAD